MGESAPGPYSPMNMIHGTLHLRRTKGGGSVEKIGNLLPKLRAQAPTEGKEAHQTVCHTN